MKMLITGATSGMGRALAEKARAAGYEILGVGRNQEELKKLETDLGARTLRADLATHEGQQVTVDWIQAELPDVLVNNAGIGTWGAAADHKIEDELATMHIDGLALLRLTLETVKAWRAAGKQGTILNVASALAYHPTPLFANYTAVKAYVSRLSQALDAELRSEGIRVLVSSPGLVRTKFSERAAEGDFSYDKVSSIPVLTPEYAAERMWKQIKSGKGVDIFNWKYNMLATLLRFAPRKKRAKVMQGAMETYGKDQGY